MKKICQEKARLFCFLLLVLAVFLPLSVLEAATVNNLRTSDSKEKTRIVLDLDAAAAYTQVMTSRQLVVELEAGLPAELILGSKGDLVQKISAQKNGASKTKLVIDLSKETTSYKSYVLKGPQRLVIDFYKQIRSKEITEEGKGLRYLSWRDVLAGNPVWLHVLEVAPASGYELRPLLGQPNLIQKGKLSAAAKQADAKAAINTSYFDKTNWIIGNLKIDQEWVSCDFTPRTALVIGTNNNAKIIQDLAYEGQILRDDGKAAVITGMNRERIANDLILYNNFYGKKTGTNAYGREVLVEKGTVTQIGTKGNLALKPGSIVLSGHGTGAAFLAGLKVGSKVKLEQTLKQQEADQAKHVIGAGPLLLRQGEVKVTAAEEGFPRDITSGRAPRTAVGVKADGSLLLVVVEGRTPDSVGLTLTELAGYLRQLGARDAMNFDGGGSSELVLDNKIMNKPSDGSERPIRAGLGLFKK